MLGQLPLPSESERNHCWIQNFRFYGIVLLKIFIPRVLYLYYARCGHLKEINLILSSFVPLVYVSGKTNYQTAIILDLIEKITMPKEAFAALYE